MNTKVIKESITDMMEQSEDYTLFADGFDEAIIGVDSLSNRVVYSVAKCYETLISRDGMDYDEAEEYFAYNVLGSMMGEKTPIWCYDLWNFKK
jgi:hypothetical protein